MIDPFSESKWAPSKSYLYGRSLRNAQGTRKVSFFIRENWSDTLRSAEHFSVILQISSAPPFSLSSMLAATVTAPAHRSDQQSDQLCNKFGFLALGEPMRVSRYSRALSSSGTMRAKVDAAILRVVLIVLSVLIIISLWGFYSSIRPPKIISSITPRDLKMDYEDVWFKTADGLTLRGWYIPCAKETQKTLILLHGYPADKGNILPALAFLHEDFNLLLFDFRYLGKSEGSYSTAGAKEVEDLLAAIQFLKGRGVKEVGVWGFSMGGAVALMAIEKALEIRAVISA